MEAGLGSAGGQAAAIHFRLDAALTQEIERYCEASQCMWVGEDELALRA